MFINGSKKFILHRKQIPHSMNNGHCMRKKLSIVSIDRYSHVNRITKL